MKCAFAVALLALASTAALGSSPVTMVVTLLTELEATIQADGKLEQKSYDKYACWCEDTLGRKANDISTAKETIDDTQTLINKLKGELGAHSADIAQLKKDIAANIAAQREAEEVRGNENMEYEKDKTEAEQCIGAVESAIKVLSGAGTGKKGFLETLQEAQLLGVVAGMRDVLKKPAATQSLSEADAQVVRRFVDRPEDFVGGQVSGAMSAAQIANNPFGDYAPQSTQIQGILKGMYDGFAANLEKSNAEEADSQKAHEDLMKTKNAEKMTLEKTLERQTLDSARKTAQLAENRQIMDDTKEQLKADEEFFADTKAACKAKAGEWSERTRLRTEELQGVAKAIEILSSPESQKTFENSSTTFAQISSFSTRTSDDRRSKAYARLRDLAGRYRSVSLGEVALQVRSTGHFDKVIASIDQMIATLRKEEQDDIFHRDRCQAAENKNKNDAEDLAHAKKKAEDEISRMGDSKTTLQEKIDALKAEIKKSKDEKDSMLQMRNKEHDDFVQALKDDTEAVRLLEEAMTALRKFYKKNRIPPPAFAQQDPEYTVDPDKAPETSWSNKEYKGKSSESGGLIAIISMIKEDTQREIKVAREEEAESQADYVKSRDALQETIDKRIALKIAAEKRLAELTGDIVDKEEYKKQQEDDIAAEEELKGAITKDCSWVESHFDSRRTARKAEMEGLVEAKDYLAGVESGDELSMDS